MEAEAKTKPAQPTSSQPAKSIEMGACLGDCSVGGTPEQKYCRRIETHLDRER